MSSSTARQQVAESAVSWACRLENIVSDIKSADPSLTVEAVSSMLRSKFWSGLRAPAARDALRHRIDSKASFADLLVAARQFEAEGNNPRTTHTSAIQGSAASPEVTEIMTALRSLNRRMDAMEKRRQPSGSFSGKCFKCGQRGHRQADCKQSGNATDRA